MRHAGPRLALSLAGVLVLAVPSFAIAQSVVIGGTDANNCYPFTCPSGGGITRYQQVYDAAAFGALAGPSWLTSVTFFPDNQLPAIEFANATFDVYFSTTSAGVGSLSTTLGDNVGTPDTYFATPAASFSISGGMFTLSGVPYLYDPGAGNLLMDVFVSGVISDAPFLGDLPQQLEAGYDAPYTSRAYSSTVYGMVADVYALQTRFDFSPTNVVPEPGTLSLLATGLTAMSLVGAGRRKKNPAAS